MRVMLLSYLISMFFGFFVFKVLGVLLIIDAIGSWLYDLERVNNNEMTEQKPVVHAVRFVRALIGTYLLSL